MTNTNNISEVLARNGLTVADIEDVQEGMNLVRDMHGVDAGSTVRSVLETVARLLAEADTEEVHAVLAGQPKDLAVQMRADARAILAEVLK